MVTGVNFSVPLIIERALIHFVLSVSPDPQSDSRDAGVLQLCDRACSCVHTLLLFLIRPSVGGGARLVCDLQAEKAEHFRKKTLLCCT